MNPLFSSSVGNSSSPLNHNLILLHKTSRTYDASSFILYLSRFLITALKKNRGGGKNKSSKLKSLAHRKLNDVYNSYMMLKMQNRWEEPPKRPDKKLIGIALRFSGRVYGAKKAGSFKILFGSVPFGTISSDLDFAQVMLKTRNGTWGFRAWLHWMDSSKSFDPSLIPFHLFHRNRL